MKNFLVSFVIVLAAFGAGVYLSPFAPAFAAENQSYAPAEAQPEIQTVNNTETPTLPRSNTPEVGSVTEVEASAYTPAELHTIRLFEEASPSVCYITTKALRRSFWSYDVTEVPNGSGSGFVWDKDGHIITNYHVIEKATKAIVTLGNGESYEADLVGVAKEKDLAVLKINAPTRELNPIPVGSSEGIRVGQAVYAIGNPFGLDQTLTTGVVSALGREINSRAGVPIQGVIQCDAAINPGNSGGPLLDSKGELIGVNTAIYSPSGASAGIGFSIPVDVVSYVVPDLIRYGEIRRATVGAELHPLRRDKGLLIHSIRQGGPADLAGIIGATQDQRGNIRYGDILVGINGIPVKTTTEYFLEMEKFQPGETVTLNVIRADREVGIPVRLGSTVE